MNNLQEQIINLMHEKSYKAQTMKQLQKVFKITRTQRTEFNNILNDLEVKGEIIRNGDNQYNLPEKFNYIKGKFEQNKKGFGFVIFDPKKKDLFIPHDNANTAMTGDEVIAKITNVAKHEGKIVRVIKRKNTTLVSTIKIKNDKYFAVPTTKSFSHNIFIAKENINNAKENEVVIVQITDYKSLEGKVIEVLGAKDDKGIDILSIIKKHHLPEDFSPEIETYLNTISNEIPKEEYDRRLDIRNLQIVTIDGDDAKDLDDAISLEKLENGNYKLGVHIADVSHYVKEKDLLDEEALHRGNSYYLLNKVIPMLPKKLSNGICSLNPAVDRLTLSCFMEIDSKGKVINSDIKETIIKTSERMTYTNVTKILNNLKDNVHDEELSKYDYLIDMFKTMEELCYILNNRRIQRGALDFNIKESKIILDENNKPIDVQLRDRTIANRIIEEFMLVCNETIAEYMYWNNIPFIYRLHEPPSEDKLEHFNEYIHNLGYTVKWKQKVQPKLLQNIIKEVEGTPEETIINKLLLRSMKQAKYSPEVYEHFGLAAEYYCHFTSPIRRYPDLMIHRIIKEFINGKINENRIEQLIPITETAAKQSSDTERTAQKAEREVDALKKAEYMQSKIGQEFTGIISSITNFGLFVELSNTIEGLIHVKDLKDDYYEFDEKTLTLTGEHTNKQYKLGDEVNTRVSRVDLPQREIYFEFVQSIESNVNEENINE